MSKTMTKSIASRIARVTTTATAVGFIMASAAQAADIVIGIPGWAQAGFHANVLKVVLEDNLGLEVELQNGNNAIIWEGMENGNIHVHPDVWLPNQMSFYDKYKDSVVVNGNGIESIASMCVDTASGEEHNITSITDLTNPDIAKLLDTNGDGRGELWVGGTGHASTNVEKVRAKSYGYDQTLDLVEMDDTVAFAARDAQLAKGGTYVGLCWNPHSMWSQHELTRLEEPPHNPDTWNVIQPGDDPDWLAKSNADSAWAGRKFQIVYAKELETSQPDAASVLANFGMTEEDIVTYVGKIENDKEDPAAVAREWVEAHPEVVDGWLK